MTDRKVATAILAAIAVVISFYNALQEHYIYAALSTPFVVACALRGRASKTMEFFGVFVAALYVVAFQAMYVGLAGLVVAFVLFFALWKEETVQKLYIVLTTAFTFCAAFVKLRDVQSVFIAAFLFASLYFVFCFVLYFVLRELREEAKNAKPLNEKCMDALEEALSTAHEALDIARKGAEDARSE